MTMIDDERARITVLPHGAEDDERDPPEEDAFAVCPGCGVGYAADEWRALHYAGALDTDTTAVEYRVCCVCGYTISKSVGYGEP